MENQTPAAAEATPNISVPENVIVHPNFDSELDAALSKSFPNAASQPEEVKSNEPKPVEKPKVELGEKDSDKRRNLEPAKTDKPVEAEKPALTSDQVDKMDPKEKGAWGAIKNANKNAHKMIEQRDSEIAKLKAVIAERGELSQKEVESLKAEKEELSKYRAMIDIQADPEFNSSYDAPMTEKIDSMKDLLKGWNISEETIRGIDFLDKNQVGSIAKILRQNEQHITSEFELEEFMSNAKEVLDLSKKRDAALKKHAETYKETLEARKKQAFEKDAEAEGKAFKHLESVVATKDKSGNPMFPFLNKMEIKDTAGQPEIDQINAHNKMVELMNQKVQQAYKMVEPEQRMEVAVAAAAAHYLSAQLKASNAKIQALQAELQKISSVTTETEKAKNTPIKRNGNILDTDEALAAYFGR